MYEGWDAFWFTPADPTLLGVIRVLTGLMLLYTHAVWGIVLGDFFGPAGWLSEGLVRNLQEGGECLFVLVARPRRRDVAGLRRIDGDTDLLHTRALDAIDVDPGAGRHDLVRPPRPGRDVRARPDQWYVDPIPRHRAERPGSLSRPMDGSPSRPVRGVVECAERWSEPGPAADQRSYVRDLPVRRALEAPGRGLVERRGDVARPSRITSTSRST